MSAGLLADAVSARPVLVTGASGFVGGYFLQALQAAGCPAEQIAALTQRGERRFASGCQTVVADLTDRSEIAALIKRLQPYAVVHLAAVAEPAKAAAAPDLAWKVNFESVRFLSEGILEFAPNARLIFAGSAEAYGASFLDQDGAIKETAALRPVSTYGATKAAADILIGQKAWQGLRGIRFRAFNHTGPGQASAYVVASFASQIAAIEAGTQEPLLRVGNLSSRRDFLDVRDVVRAYVIALTADLNFSDGPVFNLATGRSREIATILEDLLRLSTAAIVVEEDPSRYRAVDIPVASGSSNLAATTLGWVPQIDLAVTLSDTLSECRRRLGNSALNNSVAQAE